MTTSCRGVLRKGCLIQIRQNKKNWPAELWPNYAFKPTAEQALRMDRGTSCRGGLTRR